MSITLRFPRTKVPAQATTYICFTFNLPADREYHLIATQPLIDNENVMHHMTLNGCDKSGQYLITWSQASQQSPSNEQEQEHKYNVPAS